MYRHAAPNSVMRCSPFAMPSSNRCFSCRGWGGAHLPLFRDCELFLRFKAGNALLLLIFNTFQKIDGWSGEGWGAFFKLKYNIYHTQYTRFFHVYSIFTQPHPTPTRKFLFSHCSASKSCFQALFCCRCAGWSKKSHLTPCYPSHPARCPHHTKQTCVPEHGICTSLSTCGICAGCLCLFHNPCFVEPCRQPAHS